MSNGGDRVRRTVGVLGELLITAGVVVGLFAVYTLFWTGIETAREQDSLEAEFEALANPPVPSESPEPTDQPKPEPTDEPAPEEVVVPPLPGDAYARMHIPRLGSSWRWIVVEGVDLDLLTMGPGHYPDSADPGEIGNFAVAGHRATHGEPFAYLDQLALGDEVLVERGGMEYRYAVTESFVTGPENNGVLLPVPSQPGAEPLAAVLTLTTCHPRWDSTQRLIVHGVLTDSWPVDSNQGTGA